MTRSPIRPVSLQDLRRIADTLAALRSRTVSGAVMRSDRRQLRVEMADGQLLVVGVDLDALVITGLSQGRPPLEEPGLAETVTDGLAAGRQRGADAQANAWYEEAWLARDLSSLWMSRQDQVMHLPPSTEEYGVTIAASLAKYYLRQQRALGFAAYGHEREIVQPDRGERQLNRLLQVLAVLRAEGRMDFSRMLAQEATRLGRNNTLVVISPSTEIAWLKSVQEIKRRGLRVIAVLVDAKSFGGFGDAPGAAVELLASGIPALVVREGDDLRATLSR